MFGQQRPVFGATGATSTFGGSAFGARPAGSTFGAGGFGTNTAASGMFGAQTTQPAASAAGTLFGQPASTFGAGASNTGFSFGATPSAAPGTGLFGSTTQQPASAGGLFGNTSTPSVFGNRAGFGAFSSPAVGGATGGGLFGTSAQPGTSSAATGLFGHNQTSTATGGTLFGASGFQAQQTLGGMLGGAQVVGTSIKFVPVSGQDTMMKGGVSTSINTKHQCITAMKEYESKSLEELRSEDYAQGRNKGVMAGTFTGTGLFGQPQPTTSTATSSLFGGLQPKPAGFGFGTSGTTNMFGSTQPQAQQAGGLFGKPAGTGLFGATSTAAGTGFGGFGAAAPTGTTGGLFGQGNKSLFGANTSTTQTGGLFGMNTAATTAAGSTGFAFGAGTNTFGAGSTFGAQPAASTSLFGAQPSAFGATNASAPGLTFGAKPATFGAPTAAANTGFNFGATNTGFGAGVFGKPQTSQPAFGGFGQPVAAGGTGTLFGKPAGTGFGTTSGIGGIGTANTGFGALGAGMGGTTMGLGGTLGVAPNPLGGTTQLGTDAHQLAAEYAQIYEHVANLSNSPFGDAYKVTSPTKLPLPNENRLKAVDPAVHKAILAAGSLEQSPLSNAISQLRSLPSLGASGAGSYPSLTSPTVDGVRNKLDDIKRAVQRKQQRKVGGGLQSPVASRRVDEVSLHPMSPSMSAAQSPSHFTGFSPRHLVDGRNQSVHSVTASPSDISRVMLQPRERRSKKYLNIKFDESDIQDSEVSGNNSGGIFSPANNTSAAARPSIFGVGSPAVPVVQGGSSGSGGTPQSNHLIKGQKHLLNNGIAEGQQAADVTQDILAATNDAAHQQTTSTANGSALEVESPEKSPPTADVSTNSSGAASGPRVSDADTTTAPYSPHPAGVVLARLDYYTIPTLEELGDMVDENGDCYVENFTIGRNGYGSIYFPGRLNVANLNLDEIVHIRRKEVIVYPDESDTPEQGEGLNRRAEITLDNTFPVDKNTRRTIKNITRLKEMKWTEYLEAKTEEMGAKFLDFRPETGSWVFEVKHFSKYRLEDGEDDEDTVQHLQQQQRQQQEAKAKEKAPNINKVEQKDNSEQLVKRVVLDGDADSEMVEYEDKTVRATGDMDVDATAKLPFSRKQTSNERDVLTDYSTTVMSPSGTEHVIQSATLGALGSKRVDSMQQSFFLPESDDRTHRDINSTFDFATTGAAAAPVRYGDDSLLRYDVGDVSDMTTKRILFGGVEIDSPSFFPQPKGATFEEDRTTKDIPSSVISGQSKTHVRKSSIPLIIKSERQSRPQSAVTSLSDMSTMKMESRMHTSSEFDSGWLIEPTFTGHWKSLTDAVGTYEDTVKDRLDYKIEPVIKYEDSYAYGKSNQVADMSCYFGHACNVRWASPVPWVYVQNGYGFSSNEGDTKHVSASGDGRTDSPYTIHVKRIVMEDHSTYFYESRLSCHLDHSVVKTNFDSGSSSSAASRRLKCPLIATKPGVELMHSLAKLAASDCMLDTCIDIENERLVWELCVALWGNMDGYSALSNKEKPYAYSRARKEMLFEWLSSAASNQVALESGAGRSSQHVGGGGGEVMLAYQYMVSGDLAACRDVLQRSRQHRLAALVTQTGGGIDDTTRRQLMQASLNNWYNSKADRYISREHLHIVCLLAGIMLWHTSDGRQINTCDNLDWKRAFYIHLWYQRPPTASIIDGMAAYRNASMNADEGLNYAPKPLPYYLENGGAKPTGSKTNAESNKAGASSVAADEQLLLQSGKDICYYLLSLYCNRLEQRLEELLEPSSFSSNHLDYSYTWLLMHVLTSVGYCGGEGQQLSERHMSHVTASVAEQLEAVGLWHWAVAVCCYINDDTRREAAVRTILSRHISLSTDDIYKEREAFIINRLHIPLVWIHAVKAVRASVENLHEDVCIHWIKAEEWNAAHDVIVEHIAPDAIVNQEYEHLHSLLSPLAENPDISGTIHEWSTKGQIYLDFVNLHRKLADVAASTEFVGVASLETEIGSLCANITLLPSHTVRHRVCQAEICQQVFEMLCLVVRSDSQQALAIHNSNTLNVAMMMVPQDYATEQLLHSIREAIQEAQGIAATTHSYNVNNTPASKTIDPTNSMMPFEQ